MAYFSKDTGKETPKQNPYAPGSWDWVQWNYKNKEWNAKTTSSNNQYQPYTKEWLRWNQENVWTPPNLKESAAEIVAEKSSPTLQHTGSQPGLSPNTPAPTPSPAPAPTLTPTPIPEPKESGVRNTVSNSSQIITDFEEALQNGDKETMGIKAKEFLEEYPQEAVWIPYNDQYSFIFMDNQIHVFALGKGYKSAYDDMADALDYVGWVTGETTPTPISQDEGTGNIDDYFEYNWTGKHVTDEFKEKVVEISTKLQINPDDLMAIIAFESYISPTTDNSIGAIGLIQFTPATAKDLGTTTDALAKMSAVEQLDYVYKYFNLERLHGKLNSLSDLYMAVLAGRYSDAITAQDEDKVWSKEENPNEYENNKGLDINQDGIITKGEATQFVIDRRDSYGKK